MMTVFETYSETRASDIPRRQGIYAFFLDLVSPSKIGLAGKGPWSEQQLERARNVMIARSMRHSETLNSGILAGDVTEKNKGRHLARLFSISASSIPPSSFVSEIQSLPLDRIREYSSLLHYSHVFHPPIYVGITALQTLKERYDQHRRDFLAGAETGTFGARLKHSGIEWDDVAFMCIAFDKSSEHEDVLSILERHLQSLTNPALSVK